MSKRDRHLKQRLDELFSTPPALPDIQPEMPAAGPEPQPLETAPHADLSYLKTMIARLPLPAYLKDREHTWVALKSTKDLPFSSTCAAFGRGSAVSMSKEGQRKEDILNGLHEAIANRVMALVRKVGIADKFVVSGGIGRNVALVQKIEARLDGLKVNLPAEPMIVGAVGAALFALDRAKQGDEARTGAKAARRPAGKGKT